MPSKFAWNLIWFLQPNFFFYEHLKQANSLLYVQSSGLFLLTAVACKECRREAFFLRIAAKIETLCVVEFV